MAIGVGAGEEVVARSSPDAYVTLSGVARETFEGSARRTRGERISYDEGELEIMSPSLYHEGFGDRLRELVAVLCEALAIEMEPAGPTTWKAPEAKKGIEADAAFYLDAGKLHEAADLLAAGDSDILRFPSPDLVIEIELKRLSTERSGIYAAIGAVEIWEFDGVRVRIRRLGPEGQYEDVERSGWFPPVSPQAIEAVLADEPRGAMARRRWMRGFVERLIEGPLK